MSESTTFRYRPYANGVKPFSIGLALLDPARWIEPDGRLIAELAEKEQLLVEERRRVVVSEPETVPAQREVRDLLVDHLITAYPDIYRLFDGAHGREVEIVPAGRLVSLEEDLPLVAAARLIQDDLCLMRRGAAGWRLAAGVLTAPSAWSLAEQFGRPMEAIHAAVPGYAETMAAKVARIFDRLPVDKPVWRLNWSLYDDDKLFHPEPKHTARRWSGADGRFGDQAFVRVERQTLRRMPVSGDIVFTIRVYVDPVAAFRTHPEGKRLAAGLRQRLAELDEAQLRYKKLLADRDRIIQALAEMQ